MLRSFWLIEVLLMQSLCNLLEMDHLLMVCTKGGRGALCLPHSTTPFNRDPIWAESPLGDFALSALRGRSRGAFSSSCRRPGQSAPVIDISATGCLQNPFVTTRALQGFGQPSPPPGLLQMRCHHVCGPVRRPHEHLGPLYAVCTLHSQG